MLEKKIYELEKQNLFMKHQIKALAKQNSEAEQSIRQLQCTVEKFSSVVQSKPWRIYDFCGKSFRCFKDLFTVCFFKRLALKCVLLLKTNINKYPLLKRIVLSIIGHFPKLEYYLKRSVRQEVSSVTFYRPVFHLAAEKIYAQLKNEVKE